MPRRSGTRRALFTGGAAPFTPASIPGLVVWVKSDAGLYQDSALMTPAVADADPVGGWKDQSGNGNNVLQATNSARPTLKLAVQNGLPGVKGNSVNDFLNTPSLTWSGGVSMFAVASFAASGSNYEYLWQDGTNSGTTGAALGRTGATALDWQAGDGVAFGGGYNSGNPPRAIGALGAATSPIILTSVLGPSTAVLHKNGANIVRTSSQASIGSRTKAGYIGTDGFWYYGGLICELLLYSTAVSAPQIASIESYLNGRWKVY